MKGEDKDVRNKVTSYYVRKEGAVQLYMYGVVDLIHPLKLLLSPLSTLFFSEFFCPPLSAVTTVWSKITCKLKLHKHIIIFLLFWINYPFFTLFLGGQICITDVLYTLTVWLNPKTIKCGHVFCPDCLSQALRVLNVCPICREP